MQSKLVDADTRVSAAQEAASAAEKRATRLGEAAAAADTKLRTLASQNSDVCPPFILACWNTQTLLRHYGMHRHCRSSVLCHRPALPSPAPTVISPPADAVETADGAVRTACLRGCGSVRGCDMWPAAAGSAPDAGP